MQTRLDNPTWKHLETKWHVFEREPHHLRLGLGMDGVNPFDLHSTKWSTSSVVIMSYNIPPWMLIEKGHLILCLLITRKRKVNNMSIYLAPLNQELQDLWKESKWLKTQGEGVIKCLM